jgi:hypothetical protein
LHGVECGIHGWGKERTSFAKGSSEIGSRPSRSSRLRKTCGLTGRGLASARACLRGPARLSVTLSVMIHQSVMIPFVAGIFPRASGRLEELPFSTTLWCPA